MYLLKSKSKCAGPCIPSLSLLWPAEQKELPTPVIEDHG